MSKKIWASSAIESGKSYYLQLCQNDSGVRYFELGMEDASFQANPECFFRTEVIDNELLIERAKSLQAISVIYNLQDGSRFFLDAHNVWLTETEMSQLASRKHFSRIVWSTPKPPKFPPA